MNNRSNRIGGYAPINSIVPPAVQRNPEVMGFPVSQGREQSSRLPPLPCVRTQLAERLLAWSSYAQKAAKKVRSRASMVVPMTGVKTVVEGKGVTVSGGVGGELNIK